MSCRRGKGHGTDDASADRELTPREREVLSLIAQGLSNREIAARLFVSKHTLQHHITAVYAKLGGLSRSQAILHAIRIRLVTLGLDVPPLPSGPRDEPPDEPPESASTRTSPSGT